MTAAQIGMRSMLIQAGFAIRGATRADCVHCNGRSRGTVAFTAEVAFCHRCKWTANTLTLARELGLLTRNSELTINLRKEAQRRTKWEVEIKPFEAWRDAKIREVSDQYRLLSRKAMYAAEVITQFPDSEPASDAMERFYNAEAKLLVAFDWLMFAKASTWLEMDSSPAEVFETWRSHAA
jgi:hypothetical protein